ncbi:MAG: T9SS type A sorting domain-containing protein, partial [Bacteroidota bacterium]
KKITLSIFMFAMALVSFSQTELAVNGDFETGDDTGFILFPNGGTAMLDNTISNGGTWSGMLETSGPSNPAFKQEFIGAGVVAAGSDVTVSFDHIGTIVPPGGVFNVLLFGEGAGGASFTHVFNPAPALSGTWTTFSDTYTIPMGTDVSAGISFLIEAVCGGDAGCSVSANIDNISVIVDGGTTPTCDDGIQNGDEEGIDCGGSCPTACDNGDPTTDAPESGSTGTDLYVYSGLTGTSVDNFNFNQFAGPGADTTISEIDIEGNGNNAGRIQGAGAFFFYGAEWNAVDLVAGGYQFVHLNYYATTSTEFNFFLIDQSAGIPGGNPEEPRYRFGGATPDIPLVTGEWQSVFIPLSAFTDFPTPNFTYDLNDIFQYKFDGNGEIYFDNIFFSTTDVLSDSSFSISDFKVFPNPATDAWTINSTQQINEIQLFDILGKNVSTLTPNGLNVEIDASNLNKGMYFATISTDNGSQSVKLIKN